MSSQLDVSAESDIRRTCNLTLHVKDASYLAARDKKIWMDKYLRVSYGIYDPLAREYRFYAMGIYVLLNGSYAFDEASKTLSVSMVDLMALITQERGSAIGARKTVIEVNANIRNAMISTLTRFIGWVRYSLRVIAEISTPSLSSSPAAINVAGDVAGYWKWPVSVLMPVSRHVPMSFVISTPRPRIASYASRQQADSPPRMKFACP